MLLWSGSFLHSCDTNGRSQLFLPDEIY
uniref:Uncharacterized protein n=1 Tax=Arundo donax TaxID=35708 RepID=A0A0A9BM66_ARUDO